MTLASILRGMEVDVSPTTPDQLARRAQQHLNANQLEAAQHVLEQLVVLVPDDASAYASLARVMRARGQWRATGDVLLQSQRHTRPPFAQGLTLANQLLAHGEVVAARALAPALEAGDKTPEQLLELARLRFATGEITAAAALAERAVQAGARHADAYYLHGLLQQFSGNLPGARAALDTCLTLRGDHGVAAMLLAGLCDTAHAAELLARIDAQRSKASAAPASRDAHYVRAAFEHARFRLLHKLGRHADAWRALAQCNALMQALNPYAAHATQALTDALIQAPVTPASHPATPADGPIPIFIVGMPRSGTTLLDRMLSNHTQVASCGELHDFWLQLHRAADVVPSDEASLLEVVQRARTLDLAKLGKRYLAQTRWRAHGCRYYIDKWPMNIQLVGLIHAALPQAKILHIARPPMDVCFSNLKAMFGNSGAYSYSMAAVAHYHQQYQRLVEHWHQAAPQALLEVPYQALVEAPQATLERVLRYCDLTLEEACLHPERNPDAIATPSNLQVREPIHTRARNDWQAYASQLEPLQRALTQATATVPAPPIAIDPPTLRAQALQQLKAGQTHAAHASLETLVKLTPDDIPAWLQLAQLREQAGQWRAAGAALVKVTEHLPPHAPLLLNLERRLREHGAITAARRCLDFLAGAPEPPASLLSEQAERRFTLGEIAAAKALIERARHAGATDADTHYRRAQILHRAGARDQAARALADCLARQPGHVDAAVMLAGLPAPLNAPDLLALADAQIAQLAHRPDAAADTYAQAGFHYVRFRQLDAAGQVAPAWDALTQCHALMRQFTPDDSTDQDALADVLATLHPDQLQADTRGRADTVTPIFIVGLPQAGAAPLAQLLCSQPDIAAANALDDFSRHLHQLADRPPQGSHSLGDILAHVGDIDLPAVGQRYIQQARWRAQGRRCFVDTHPRNFLLVPLIHAALPQAKILYVTRAPLDVCFANMQTFSRDALPASHAHTTLAHCHVRHLRIAQHWRTTFPAAMFEVAYADLMANPAATLTAVLHYCALGAPSGRLPVATNASPAWTRYAAYLQPLQQALAATT